MALKNSPLWSVNYASVRKGTPAVRVDPRKRLLLINTGHSPVIPPRRASAGFDRSNASLHLMFLGMVADVSLCAIEGVGLAHAPPHPTPPPRAGPEILPPDYRLARMTEAAFHTNAVNT